MLWVFGLSSFRFFCPWASRNIVIFDQSNTLRTVCKSLLVLVVEFLLDGLDCVRLVCSTSHGYQTMKSMAMRDWCLDSFLRQSSPSLSTTS